MKRRAITLVELLVVMALISFVVGAIAYPISRWIQVERFSSSCRHVENMANLCQELMWVGGCDLELILAKNKEGIWEAQIEGKGGIPDSWTALLNRKQPLNQVEKIFFPGQNKEEPSHRLPFLSAGSKVARGTLILEGVGRSYFLSLDTDALPYTLKSNGGSFNPPHMERAHADPSFLFPPQIAQQAVPAP